MEIPRRTITIDGLLITYYQLGTGEPLLFLHGGRLRALTFRRALRQLAERYTVIAPDIPGYGASETPDGVWSYTDYAAFFKSFLDKLGFEGATAVGYSMGGGIAFNLAAISKRVTRLVLVDSAGLREPGASHSMHHGRRLSFYLTHPRYYRAVCVFVGELMRYSWKHRTDGSHMRQIRNVCRDTPYGDKLAVISVPTLLLWGKDDCNIPLETAKRFHKLLPNSRLEVVPGIHDWPVYNPLLLGKSVL